MKATSPLTTGAPSEASSFLAGAPADVRSAVARAAELREAADKAHDRYYRRYGAALKKAMEDAHDAARKACAAAATAIAQTPKGAEAFAAYKATRVVWVSTHNDQEAAVAAFKEAQRKALDGQHGGLGVTAEDIEANLQALAAAGEEYKRATLKYKAAEDAYYRASEAWHAIAGKSLYAHQVEEASN